MSGRLTNIGLAALSFAVCFLCAECAIRFLAPQEIAEVVEDPAALRNARPVPDGSVVERDAPIYARSETPVVKTWTIPNSHVIVRNNALSHRDIPISINSIGLRYPELGPKEPGEYRVLVLGDSITMGDYVLEEETIPGQMEQLAKSCGPKIRVINAGFWGANTIEEYYHYRAIRDAVKPDAVLVAMFLNDSQPTTQLRVRAVPAPWNRSQLLVFLARRLNILRLYEEPFEDWRESLFPSQRGFCVNRTDRWSGKLESEEDANTLLCLRLTLNDYGRAWFPEGWERLKEPLALFRDDARAHGIRIGFSLFSLQQLVFGSYRDGRPGNYFAQTCSELGLLCHDTLDEMREAARTKTRGDFYYDHCHMTPEGNRVAAEALFRWLKRADLLPCPAR